MKAIKYLGIVVSSLLLLNSCTKDVAGPTGPTGPPGSQGSSAAYYVTVDSVIPSAWVIDGTGTFYDATIKVASLTNPNTSVVEVYFAQTYNSHSQWYELPLGYTPIGGGGQDLFQFYYYTYYVVLQYLPSAPVSKLYFKVVVITNP